jgi:two-component system OmpR family response regulator
MQETNRVLLAEDDVNLGNLLKEYLEIKGFEVVLARDGIETLKLYVPGKCDLLILDVMMPRKDGFAVAREIRKSNNQLPIIFLTAKGEKEDKMEGFEAGADDYLTKPFSMEELLARIKAVLRRSKSATPAEEEQKVFNLGTFDFDYNLQSLKHGGIEIKVSTKEADLLRMLCLHKNSVMLRELALKEIWGDDDYFNARSMDVYITKLRKYLKADPNIQLMNVHGKGYKLMVG